MTVDELQALFDQHDDEYIEFERVENKFSRSPDLHAFILLDQLMPADRDIISCAEHDEIYLDFTPENLAQLATEAQIIELIRCGVRLYDDSLKMFV